MKKKQLLPHELPKGHGLLLERLPKLAERDTGPLDMTPAALIASLKSHVDPYDEIHDHGEGYEDCAHGLRLEKW